MVDTNALRAQWVKKGLKQSDVAARIGMKQKTFSSRMKKRVFGSDEIEKLISVLDISDPMSIFLLAQ